MWWMSKARAIILSVTVEGLSQTEAAVLYGVSKSWVSKLIARHRVEGVAAFEPGSRRPKTSPGRVADVVNETVVNLREQLTSKGLDAGPKTIQWHLQHHHDIDVSVATIRRRLVAAGLVEPEPNKRPKSSYIRFEADLPNETWQSDFTHIYLADGTNTETITWLDDHSRFALCVETYPRITARIVVDTFNKTAAQHGYPASTLTDNGMVYTTRLATGVGGRNRFETRLATLGITQKNSQPGHPTTCGKVERFQQTMKKWSTAKPPATTISELRQTINAFVSEYNYRRPHSSIGRVPPHVAYTRRPKDHPAGDHRIHHRVRYDRVDKTGKVSLRRDGRMHHIGIGRAHTRAKVILIIDDLNIRVINTTTGEILRKLILDPNIGYQPRFKT